MNIQEFTAKFSEATKNLSKEESIELLKLFQNLGDSNVQTANAVGRACTTSGGDYMNYKAPAFDGEINELTPRLARLRENYLNATPSIAINRALAFTEVTKEHFGLPRIVLRAKCFRRACETAPLLIQDDELIVGHPSGRPRAGQVSPDIAWRWVNDELDTMATRPQDPFFVSEEDKKILREQIFPFWQTRSVDEICEAQYRDAGVWEFSGETFVSDLSYHQTNGGGDTCPGYDVVLVKKGINGVKAEAEAHLAELSMENPEDMDKIYFYRAAIETCEGILAYAKRLSDYAFQKAQVEPNPQRKAELEKIGTILTRVPANPPQTFHEALQSVWTVESLFMIEENQTGISLGRLDQYTYPMFKADIEAGRMNKHEAYELLGCFFIKCSEFMWLSSEGGATYFAGYQPFINCTLGGQLREGGDATNDLTYLAMDAQRLVRMYQPSIAARIHNRSPQKYMQKIVQLVKAGLGFPACHFDDCHIKMMLAKGFDIEDARDYCLMGCVEPQKSGRIYQWTSTGYTQWPIAIEFVLNRGVMQLFQRKVGVDTGDLANIQTYEQFDAACKEQLKKIVNLSAIGTVVSQRVHRDIAPKPLMNIMVEGCMMTGKGVMDGGANINAGPGLIFSGLATYADSMAAIKKLVFEDRKYTLAQMRDALNANFEGYEDILTDCINAPKYGNDIAEVDDICRDLVNWTEKECNKYDMLYSKMRHGTLSISNNTPIGALTGAMPNGRKAYTPLSDGISPTQGSDKKGPTAIIKSVSKMSNEDMNIGLVHNFKLLRGILETKEGENALIQLLRTASILGNGEMQFSYVSNDDLEAAQQHPDEYRDLIIRVAGYSAYFVELCKEVQDEIISRTMLEKF